MPEPTERDEALASLPPMRSASPPIEDAPPPAPVRGWAWRGLRALALAGLLFLAGRAAWAWREGRVQVTYGRSCELCGQREVLREFLGWVVSQRRREGPMAERLAAIAPPHEHRWELHRLEARGLMGEVQARAAVWEVWDEYALRVEAQVAEGRLSREAADERLLRFARASGSEQRALYEAAK